MTSVVWDGIASHHMRAESDAERVTEISDLLTRLVSDQPRHADLVQLHDRLAATSAIDVADDLVAQIRQRRLPKDRIGQIGRHLAEQGTRRDIVKIGIVLLGAAGDEHDRDLLLLLGTLEEFTLYAVIALRRTQPNGQRAVYELARRVRNWGRIHAVERLKGCDDPEIKGWLLREGFRNGILNEYLAYIAATTGDLYSALLEPDVDDALLDGAAAILAALAEEHGPAKDMIDYADALPAMSRFADLLATRAATLRRLNNLIVIATFLRKPGEKAPWPVGEIARLRGRYDGILADARWRDLVLDHLADPHRPDFNRGLWAAERLRLPVVPQVMAYLEIEPLDEFAWYHAIRLTTSEDVHRLCGLAERLLPLRNLANGPGDHYGFGPGCEPDRALESVVSGLNTKPGAGLPLIDVALRNRVVRIRRAAMSALTAWPPDAVPEEALAWVRAASTVEPNEEIRREMTAFLEHR
ncbi:hypothetical protein Aple_045220 [Acrocarpospora pleiomorpha]|uniref:Uncharacterized protein n=2 Tax=Acrocarpospora pleiomorpha TaxID=90975 RepID=A0A5M3XLL3_9ACTN|nr:hypothetical protein Aple_045220 [Acrocarpospora pleiomorpha]